MNLVRPLTLLEPVLVTLPHGVVTKLKVNHITHCSIKGNFREDTFKTGNVTLMQSLLKNDSRNPVFQPVNDRI